MKKKYNFGGISADTIDENTLKEKFTLIDYDDEEYYISNEIFHHDINNECDEDFAYRYGIEILNLDEYDGSKKFSINLCMIPLSEYTFTKLNVYNDGEYFNSVEDIEFALECIREGYTIPFGGELLKYPDNDVDGDVIWNEARSLANICANFVSTINSIRGFYLDKPLNLIGTTGWDMLGEYAYGGKSWMQITLDRYK